MRREREEGKGEEESGGGKGIFAVGPKVRERDHTYIREKFHGSRLTFIDRELFTAEDKQQEMFQIKWTQVQQLLNAIFHCKGGK